MSLAAVAVLAAFWLADYKREQRIHLNEETERLREEAKVLAVARMQLVTPDAFQRYLDAYCRQMEEDNSPGHHILITDRTGRIEAKAHVRADAALEAKMTRVTGNARAIVTHKGQDYLVVGLAARGNATILVAQSLAPVQRVIRRQAISRAISMTALVAAVMGIISILLARWVRRPIRSLVQGVEAVREGKLDYRVGRPGTAEFEFLADGFNRMAASLADDDRRRRLDMEKARRIHYGLFPPETVVVPGLAWAARYVPADAIGGDYYDILECPDGNRLLLIADVSGHGVSAALVSAMLKALTAQAVRHGSGVMPMVDMLNTELVSLTTVEHFVTFLGIVYEPSSGSLKYVSCGHEPGLIVHADSQTPVMLGSTGPPLGIAGETTWTVASGRLASGDRLCLLTDGLPEAVGENGALLGRERLIEIMQGSARASPHEQVDRIFRRIEEFRRDAVVTDDMTLAVFQR